jgi:signal transduction histidine kinase
MSPETKKRIFEPFFTTRGEVGTGLGLWVTSGIVEKHHGTLRVRSSTGPQRSGSVFVLIFPYSSQTPTERRTAVDRQVPATVA